MIFITVLAPPLLLQLLPNAPLHPQQPEKQRPRQNKPRHTTAADHLRRPDLALPPKIPLRPTAGAQRDHERTDNARPNEVEDEAPVGLEPEDARRDAEERAREGADVGYCLWDVSGWV